MSRGLENVQTWQHVKSIRKEYYRRNSVDKCSGFVSDEDINHHFDSLSLLLGINNVTSKIENLSEKEISTGAEMFVYLNSCPSYWVYFYHEILNSTNSFPEIIQLTLNTLKRKTKRKGEYIASKFLSKLSSELGFEYIVPNEVKLGNVELKYNSIRNVKGDEHFFVGSIF